MTTLVFDTETAGLNNPRLVQLGAGLYNDHGEEMSAIDTLVQPDGFTIPPDATAVHGISTETAERFGVPVAVAVVLFTMMVRQADLIVAHNFSFDDRVVHGELQRMGSREPLWPPYKTFCTMKATEPICQLPGRYPGKFKSPKLSEAYRHFFNEELVGAHNAMVDVRGCARIHFKLKNG